MGKKHVTTILICCAVFMLTFMMDCRQAAHAYAPLSAKTLHLCINGYDIEIPLCNNGASYDVKTLNIEFPNSFVLLNSLEGVSVSVDGQTLSKNIPANVNIDKISYDKHIAITTSDGRDIRTVYIRTLNSNIPTYTAAGRSPYDGHYYITHFTLPMLLKLDQSGEIVYYLCANDHMGTTFDVKEALSNPDSLRVTMSYWDFKKHILPNGQIRYSYHEQNPGFNRLNMVGYAGGVRVIMDEAYNEIDRIKLVAGKNSSLETAEGHDFYLIDKGHYLVSNYELRLVHNIPKELNPQPQGSKVIAAHLQEIKDGTVLLDWYSTDHEILYALSEDGYNDYANAKSQQPDYAHFNSVDIDPNDGNLICSFRNLSTILKIDRRTGNIVWKLSGKADEFGLTDYQKTSNQHTAILTKDGYITIFDNNVRTRKTRVLKLKIDEKAKKLVSWNEYIVPGHFSVVCGSAMNLEKEVFVIGWGVSLANFAALTEIDFATGRKQFELTFPAGKNATYRCLKYK